MKELLKKLDINLTETEAILLITGIVLTIVIIIVLIANAISTNDEIKKIRKILESHFSNRVEK